MTSETPLLVDTGRGFSLRYRGKWLYSSRAPLDAPLQSARGAAVQPNTLYVLPSPCLWHGVGEFIARLPESSAVLCVESDPALADLARRAAAEAGIPPQGSRFSFVEARDAISAALAARSLGLHRRAVELRLSLGWSLDAAFYESVLSALDADISTTYRNRLSMVRMGRLWTRNVIGNLADMAWETVRPLALPRRPMVVCGAGPSLEAALPFIRRHRGDVAVVSCDTAVGGLAAGGISPDAIVCLEAQVYNVPDFLPLARRDEPSLIVDLSAHPSSYRASSGAKALVLSRWTDSAFLRRLSGAGLPIEPVPPLGSVGVLALEVALNQAKGAPVFLAGLDFSFLPGATHAAGTPVERAEAGRESRLYKDGSRWAATFRAGVRRTPNGGLTDPALSMYAALAASELETVAGARVYDLRGRSSAPLPATAVTQAEAALIVRSWREGEGPIGPGLGDGAMAPPAPGGDPACLRSKARAFLAGELDRAREAADALKAGADGPSLQALLSEADFLYAHFPDPERVLSLESDALNRVAAEAAYWKGCLEAALSAGR